MQVNAQTQYLVAPKHLTALYRERTGVFTIVWLDIV